MDWSDNTWAAADAGPWNEGPPVAGDSVTIINSATILTLKEPTPVLANFSLYGGKIILADDAGADTCGSITANSYAIATGSTIEVTATGQYGTGPFLDISGTAADIDLRCLLKLTGGDLLIVDGFILASGGDIDTGPYDIIVTGLLQRTGGTVTSCNIILKGSVNTSWNISTEPLTSIRFYTGYDPNVNMALYTEKLIVDAGATKHGYQEIRLKPVANNFIDIQGTLGGGGDVRIEIGSNLSASGRIFTDSDVALIVTAGTASRSLELSGEVNVPGLTIQNTTNFQYTSVSLTNSSVSIGDVILGYYYSNLSYGKLSLHGTAKIDSLIRKTGNISSLHEVNLNSSLIELSGTIDGSDIIFTADAETCHIVNPIGGSGRLTNLDPDNQVHAHDCTVDGDCVNISADTEVYPSSAALMGAGI